MSAIQALSSAASGAPAATGKDAFAELSSGQFMKILMTELTTQDPLKPNDSGAILEQLSSLRNIESQVGLQEKLENLVLQNSIAQAGGMIGKVVEGLNMENQQVSGMVTAVRVVDGQAQLELDSGQSLALERVTAIVNGDGTGAASLVQ